MKKVFITGTGSHIGERAKEYLMKSLSSSVFGH